MGEREFKGDFLPVMMRHTCGRAGSSRYPSDRSGGLPGMSFPASASPKFIRAISDAVFSHSSLELE